MAGCVQCSYFDRTNVEGCIVSGRLGDQVAVFAADDGDVERFGLVLVRFRGLDGFLNILRCLCCLQHDHDGWFNIVSGDYMDDVEEPTDEY